MKYTVKPSQTIYDVCLSANGSFAAVDENLTLNDIETYTPTLDADTSLTLSDVIYNNIAITIANKRPFVSSSGISDSEINTMIDNAIALMP